jgi:hypothetical protein
MEIYEDRDILSGKWFFMATDGFLFSDKLLCTTITGK